MLYQENQGVSVARNTGMVEATGKYITFPDIDDEISPQMYGRLFLDGLVDLPFALPTAVAGLTLATLFATSGWYGARRTKNK